ncbi:MAG: hypothetical protein RL386_1964 [Bacteroidota bacterium]|jgi:hypothetical protein
MIMGQYTSALLPTAYLPPIPYLGACFLFGRIFIEQWEHYQKGGTRNRCFIATANGPQRLTIPLLKGKHQQLPVREVRIDYREPWVKTHWQAIRSAYGRAPFYEEYTALLLPVFERRPAFLFDLNQELLRLVLGFLKCPRHPELNEAYVRSPADTLDLRAAFRPNYMAGQPLQGFQVLPYPQLFEDRNGFLPGLSILDLLYCLGPGARDRIIAGISFP